MINQKKWEEQLASDAADWWGDSLPGVWCRQPHPPKQTLAGWFSPKIQGANISVRFMHGNDVLAMTTPSFLWNFPRVVIKTGCCLKKHQVCIRWCIPSTLKIPCDCLSVCSLYFSDKLYLSFFLSFVFLIFDFMLRFILMDYMYKLCLTVHHPFTLFMHVILRSRVISTHSDFYFAHHFPTSHTNFLWTFYIKGTSLEINPGPHYFHICCGTSFHKPRISAPAKIHVHFATLTPRNCIVVRV